MTDPGQESARHLPDEETVNVRADNPATGPGPAANHASPAAPPGAAATPVRPSSAEPPAVSEEAETAFHSPGQVNTPGRGAAGPARPGHSFGDYELLHKVAGGGMGVVYKARQKKLNRIVALKMILSGNLATPEEVQRFSSEAETIAQLDHPGIVPIYEVGEHQGRHYFSMGYIEGGSLAARVKEGPLPPSEAAELMMRVAEAVGYAHQHGIIHRDLKPANVLLDHDGHPRVTDFGLAKKVQGTSHLTLAGEVLGTPSYMPPEQAAGKTEEVGPAADVYSTGATLYCLLTGRPPFQSANAVETLRQVLEQEPVSPRQLNAAVGRDLETICLKCLQKEPGKRYASALALADDLRRFLAGEPIQARPVGRAERLWRLCRRHPLDATLTAAVVVLLVLGTVVAWVLKGQAEEERRQAVANARRADREARAAQVARLESDRRWYVAEITLAQRAWQEGRIAALRQRLDRLTSRRSGARELRGFEWYYLRRLTRLDLDTLRGHRVPLRSVAFSPDGRHLATAGGEPGQPGEIKVWDLETREKLLSLRCDIGPVWSLAFSPDGRRLVTAGASSRAGQVKVWNVATGREVLSLPGDTGPVYGVAFSPDGRRLATGGGRTDPRGLPLPGLVQVWDAATGQLLLCLRGHQAQVRAVVFRPDGCRLASAGHDGLVKVWDLGRGKEALTLDGHTDNVTAVAFSADGRYLASGSSDRTVKVWDVGGGRQELFRTLQHAGPVQCLAFSGPGGQRLAVGSADHLVKVWDTVAARQVLTLRGHAAAVHGVAFSPDGRCLASVGEDREARVWDATRDQEVTTLRGHASAIYQVAFDPRRERLASVSHDRTVRLWELSTGLEAAALHGHAAGVWGVAFSPDGRLLASASLDRTVRLWDAANGRETRVLSGHPAGVRSVAFSPDGRRLASACEDGTVTLWQVPGGGKERTLRGPACPVSRVAFSPNSEWVAAACGDGLVIIWEAATGRQRFALRGHTAPVLSVTFSPDGELLASAGQDRTVRVWDTVTGRAIHTLSGHAAGVWEVAFSPDGRRIAAGGAGQVKLWDVATGQEVFLLRGPGHTILSVAFSPDGRKIAAAGQSSSVEQAVLIWDASPLTSERLQERSARSLVSFWLAKQLSREKVTARIRGDRTVQAAVRQRALRLIDACWRAEVRTAAEARVRTLFSRPLFRDGVLEHLRADRTLSDLERLEALALARRLVENPQALDHSSREVVRRPHPNPAASARALRQAERACALAPHEGSYHTTLGVALYRAGKYREAVEALTRAGKLNAATGGARPADLAFTAMAQFQRGRRKQALTTLRRLREVMKQPRWARDEEARACVREAEELLNAPAGR
jgi:WD40 repeat protein/tRNA A-37 threonylcarbamoyl transferase component Bud32